jgi:hypothetical protein
MTTLLWALFTSKESSLWLKARTLSPAKGSFDSSHKLKNLPPSVVVELLMLPHQVCPQILQPDIVPEHLPMCPEIQTPTPVSVLP